MPGASAEVSLIYKYLWVLNWTILSVINAYSTDWLNSKSSSQWEGVDLPALDVMNKPCKYCFQFLEYSSGWGMDSMISKACFKSLFSWSQALPLNGFHLGCKDLCAENMYSQIWQHTPIPQALNVTIWTGDNQQDTWQYQLQPGRKQAALTVQVCTSDSAGLASAASELRKEQSETLAHAWLHARLNPGFDNQRIEIF